MHSRENARGTSRVVVRGILSLVVLSGGLFQSANGLCREPWEVMVPPPITPDRGAEEVVEGGVAATVLFASFGIGLGAAAATLDAESERLRADPCRSCPGGFNDMQRDMAFLANASILSFVGAGVAGLGTALYAIQVEDDVRTAKKKKFVPQAVVRFQGGLLGVQVLF
ncbi:hypothetical protein [Polyangium mundeleinium]|uniref:Uncharacterized protein n=1 Tax=Polyangium mundeleinium TaxID=2995306 RepID=A0ABT5EQL4_9BACT|nr:hypothetical protein [Polyangium mundeleinium]MDC0744125.1 hypothetical protein [Polyangium mundeleinium]